MCDATGTPPQTDDIDLLVREWVGIVAARAALLADPPSSFSKELRPMMDELEARQEAWRAALDVARQRVGAQRVGVAQVRRYQRLDGAADF
jgi:hypothetical protein